MTEPAVGHRAGNSIADVQNSRAVKNNQLLKLLAQQPVSLISLVTIASPQRAV